METNLNYQRRLAKTLVAGLGIEAAMDIARDNAWDGVLAQMCANGAPGGHTLPRRPVGRQPERCARAPSDGADGY